MQHNPLIIPILAILKTATDKIGEYDIICRLEEQGMVFPADNDSYNVAIFKKHFMIMNALYHLQQELFEDGYYLNITVLDITIEPLGPSTNQQLLMDAAEHNIRDYYLDWRHFDNTSEDEINELLSNFWQMYYAQDKQGEALEILELNSDAGWDRVKRAYRRLAAEHHPDKGGNDARFIEIREAYEVLKYYYSQGLETKGSATL